MPRHLGLHPGTNWSTSPRLFYVYSTVALFSAVIYPLSACAERRHQYFSLAVGTLLLSPALLHGTRLIEDRRRIVHLVATVPGLDATQRDRLASGIVAALVIVVSGIYAPAYLVAGPINGWLDQLLGIAPLWGNFPLFDAGLA